MLAATNTMRPLMEQKHITKSILVPSLLEGRMSPAIMMCPSVRKTPIVYPALLSHVAQVKRRPVPPFPHSPTLPVICPPPSLLFIHTHCRFS